MQNDNLTQNRRFMNVTSSTDSDAFQMHIMTDRGNSFNALPRSQFGIKQFSKLRSGQVVLFSIHFTRRIICDTLNSP